MLGECAAQSAQLLDDEDEQVADAVMIYLLLVLLIPSSLSVPPTDRRLGAA